MVMKLNKEELKEIIAQALNELTKPEEKKEQKVEPETSEPETIEIPIEEDVEKELATVETQEPYICGNCGYEDTKPFNPCPKCGKELEW